MEIETERLIIRRTTEQDSDFCLSIWVDDNMGKYLSDSPRELASENYLNFAVGIEKDTNWMPFVVIKKESMELVATTSLVPDNETYVWDDSTIISETRICNRDNESINKLCINVRMFKNDSRGSKRKHRIQCSVS